jgi:hypothetical protein
MSRADGSWLSPVGKPVRGCDDQLRSSCSVVCPIHGCRPLVQARAHHALRSTRGRDTVQDRSPVRGIRGHTLRLLGDYGFPTPAPHLHSPPRGPRIASMHHGGDHQPVVRMWPSSGSIGSRRVQTVAAPLWSSERLSAVTRDGSCAQSAPLERGSSMAAEGSADVGDPFGRKTSPAKVVRARRL